MPTALLLAAPLVVAQAHPPTRGYVSVRDPPAGRTRTEIILITPAPTMMGQTIILTPRPHGGRGVTVLLGSRRRWGHVHRAGEVRAVRCEHVEEIP